MKKIKKETKSMSKQLFSLTKNNIIAAGTSYFLTIQLINYLGPHDFGVYSYILLIGTFFSVLISFSTESTASALYASLKNKLQVINIIYSIRFIFFILMVLTLPFLWLKSPILSLGVFAISITSLNFSFFYELSEDNIKYSYIYLLERLLYVFIVFILLSLNSLNLSGIFIIFFLSSSLSLAWQFNKNKKIIKRTQFIKQSELMKYIKDNSFLVLITYSTFVYGGFSRLIIENKFGMEELGIYSAGWQLIMIVTMFQAQVIRVWRLKISSSLLNQNINSLYKHIKSYFFLSTLPIIILSIVVNIYSVELVSLLFNEEYKILTELIPIFSLYFIVINLDGLSTIFWVAIASRLEYLIINICISILLVIFLYLLPENASLSTLAKIIVFTHGFSVFLLIIRFYFKYISNFNQRIKNEKYINHTK